MKSHTRVVVIGGGVVGCSVLYHLTKFGWDDVILVERAELTSGSTWHAAGGFHTLNADPNIAALQGYTIRLYRELEALTGQSCGLHHVGGVTIATDPDRMDFLKAERAKHRHMDLETELVTPCEIKELCPVLNIDDIVGGLYDPLDGHLDPAGTTQAYAMAARQGGAQISLRNRVVELLRKPDDSWDVVTEQGTINCEFVVNAAGLWAREVGAMAGVYLPLHPMEHQYLVTDDIREVYERESELPHIMDPAGETYFRQEGRGLVIGIYEQACEPWAVDGTSWDFGAELLPDKLDRIEAPLAEAYRRYPCLATAGIKRIINGPFTFAPDGNPLVGPVPGLPGYWSACAVMAGFSQGGGVGRTVAEWMIEGEPSSDVFAMDVARFGDYTNKDYTRLKVMENYQRRFAITYPNEELPAARPLHTTPAHDIWKAQNAVFGASYGMEVVNYFARQGEKPYETPSFRRSNAFETVGEECRAVRTAVGLNEIHNFSKFEVSGPGAEAWLNRILANRMPKPGRITLSPMLNPNGNLIGDLTVSHISRDRFQIVGSYAAQAYHMRWFQRYLPSPGVTIENVSDGRIGFQIAGPMARDLLGRITNQDLSTESFPFLGVREMAVGDLGAIVNRISYTGDLGYEIYVARDDQAALYEILNDAGGEFGLRPFGMRAIMSLRLEKSFGSWLREYKPDYSPAETGLDRFVNFDKGDFIGREAALAARESPPARRLITLVVEAGDADVWADEPIWRDGEVVGFVTSGGYAHFAGRSVALGFVPVPMIAPGAEFEIEILGDMRPATLITEPLFDPKGERMRG
ncbi:MAG: FAD-dependent oxidoreductase [Alphaproteobacteria bacterium]